MQFSEVVHTERNRYPYRDLDYNSIMRFAIEHLPRIAATYQVTPVDYKAARSWLTDSDLTSLVRTTELAGAIEGGFGVTLAQADMSISLKPGDEALLICLSFSVLLAWAQGGIIPLEEDWRCLLVQVQNPRGATSPVSATATLDVTSN
jgi:hypothetical protein